MAESLEQLTNFTKHLVESAAYIAVSIGGVYAVISMIEFAASLF